MLRSLTLPVLCGLMLLLLPAALQLPSFFALFREFLPPVFFLLLRELVLAAGQVFENGATGNNVAATTSAKTVNLTPPPDLDVTDITGLMNNINISGGIKNFPYRLSVGYQDQNGILKTDNLQRTSVSLAINPVLFDNHLRIDLNLKGSLQHTRFANSAAIGGATSFDPTQPVFTKSPRFGGYYEWLDTASATGLQNLAGRNPLGLLEQHFNRATPKRSIGNLQVDYKFHFLPELHLTPKIGK